MKSLRIGIFFLGQLLPMGLISLIITDNKISYFSEVKMSSLYFWRNSSIPLNQIYWYKNFIMTFTVSLVLNYLSWYLIICIIVIIYLFSFFFLPVFLDVFNFFLPSQKMSFCICWHYYFVVLILIKFLPFAYFEFSFYFSSFFR